MMKFVCYNDFERLPESANALFKINEKHSLFFSRLWFENLVATSLTDAQQIYLACVLDNNKVLAILPLMKRTQENWYSLTNRSSSLFTLLLAENNQQQILSCLVKGISKLPFQSLRLESISIDDRAINSLQKAFENSGFKCHKYFQFFNWIYPLKQQSFNQYMNTRPGKVKNTINRKSRKLEREHGYSIRVYKDAEIETALSDYYFIYKASWKADEAFEQFTQGLVESSSRSGWLRLAILSVDNQPVAGQIWFIVHGKASIFRLVYDETWKQYSPGSILIKYMMEYVIDTDKVYELDFLTGNEPYKQDWMSERRERWGLHCKKNNDSKKKAGIFSKSFKTLLNKRV